MSDFAVTVQNIYKTFQVGTQEVDVLKDVNFTVANGEFVVIFGPSGCGKSTLLHTMLGLEPPSSGKVTVLGNNLYFNTVEDDRSEIRKRSIGMVYQQPNWIKSFTVIDNVLFPLLLLGMNREEVVDKGIQALERMGMKEWGLFMPTELSGGQQQKIALARAIVTDPQIIVADEPTGNLDYESGQELMLLLQELNRAGKTIIMVTHDLEYIKYARIAIQILDGKVVEIYDEKNKKKLLSGIKSKRSTSSVSHTKKDDKPEKTA